MMITRLVLQPICDTNFTIVIGISHDN